jgi:hypothetical protein
MATMWANSCRVRLALATVAAAVTVGTATAAPVGAADGDGGMAALCRRLVEQPPPGGAALDTDPPPDGYVRAGQRITVRLRWDPRLFAGDHLRKVAHCVTVGGEPIEAASAMESPAANDGEYQATFTVPKSPPGSCFCVRGVVSGDGPDGRPEAAGDEPACLTVAGPPPGPPSTAPLRPPAEVPPAPAPAASGPSADSVTTTNRAAPAVLPAALARPVPLTELPRTGPSEVRFLLLLAGLALLFGGGAQLFPRREQAARR